MSIIVASAVLAFCIALPFGPVSLLCVQRSIMRGARYGLVCGAGAATAHCFFASLAIAGTGPMTTTLTSWQPVIQTVSGCALMLIGSKIFLKFARVPRPVVSMPGLFTDYGTGLLTALTNPITVVSYLAIASSGMMTGRADALDLGLTVAGVLLGSITWYAIVSGSASALRSRLPQHLLPKLNLLGGGILIAMGLRLVLAA